MSYFKALRFTKKVDREIELQKQCQNSINEAIKYYEKYYEEKLGRKLSLMEQDKLKNKIIKHYYGDMRYENKVGD